MKRGISLQCFDSLLRYVATREMQSAGICNIRARAGAYSTRAKTSIYDGFIDIFKMPISHLNF